MELTDLALLMARLGALSFGGGLAVLAEMQRELVDVHGAMTARDFASAYALGQASPGPGILFVIPVGYFAAGWAGAIVATTAFLAPPLTIQMLAARHWATLSRKRWIRTFDHALLPISVGLTGAGLFAISRPLLGEPLSVAGIGLSTVLLLVFRVSPTIIVLGAGALAAALAAL
jgi:chromate transporter